MPSSRNLRRTLLLNVTLVAAASIIILGCLWIRQEYVRFSADSSGLRRGMTETRRAETKKAVDEAVAYVEFKKQQTQARAKAIIRERGYQGYAIANGLYERYRDSKSPGEIKSIIKEALGAVRLSGGRNAYFVMSPDGADQLQQPQANQEAPPGSAPAGSPGILPMNKAMEFVAKQGEGFVDYAPATSDESPGAATRVMFARHFEPFDWVIGTDELRDEVEKTMKQEALDWLETIRFGNDGYVFVGQWDGVSLEGPAKGRNMIDVTDANGVKIVRELIARARTGGGFVSYVMPALDGQRSALKVSYVKGIKDWQWYVGAGVYADDTDSVVARARSAMVVRVKRDVIWIVILLATLVTAAYLIARRTADRTESAFCAFSSFFSQAATESREMDTVDLGFAEFHALAGSANQMIRERRRAEAALIESEARYRLLFDSGADAIFVHEGPEEDGLPGRFVEVNEIACKRLGYTREELLTKRPTDIDAPHTPRPDPDLMRRLLADGQRTFEGVHVAKDGRLIPVEIVNRPFELNGRHVILSTVRDLTERKRAEEEKARLETQLRQSQKMEAVGQLAGGIAHDFNNLLQVIEGYADMAMGGLEAADRRRTDLMEVKKAAHRAASLTRQLLTFSRREALKPESILLDDVISNMTRMLRRLVGERIELVVHSQEGTMPVHADRSQVEQVLMNLAINARDAIRGTGRIVIQTANASVDDAFRARHPEAEESRYVCLSVCDTGVGISSDVQERMFEPFFTTKQVGEGTGLGLATVYAVVKRHAGVIEVSSEPGAGTTFRIYLPAAHEPADGAGRKTEQESLVGGEEIVLLAEDDEAVRNLTVEILERAGYSLIVARDGEEALTLAKHAWPRIHLAILDVVMPKKDGREVGEELKEIRPGMPVLFSSGYSYDAFEGAKPLAAEQLIQKPYSAADLLRKVREVLDAAKTGGRKA